MINIFISDLHLESLRIDITDIFLNFLKTKARQADRLFILGDFFEVWLGDDDLNPFSLKIMSALRDATQQGLAIFIMHGNRDFLLGKKFLNDTGCILLPEEHVIDINGTRILLMHGDTLCTLDKKYLAARKKMRNWFFQKLILWKSLEKRKALAAKYREASKSHTSTAAEHILDVTQKEVERVMRKHGVQHLIHGHTHRPAVHTFQLDGLPATRTVLGAWHEKGNVLIWDEKGKKELIDF